MTVNGLEDGVWHGKDYLKESQFQYMHRPVCALSKSKTSDKNTQEHKPNHVMWLLSQLEMGLLQTF